MLPVHSPKFLRIMAVRLAVLGLLALLAPSAPYLLAQQYLAQQYNKVDEKSVQTDLSNLSLAGLYVLPVEKRVRALNFNLEDLKTKQNMSLSDFKDQVLVLNYWATWCPPCRAEMPMIQSLHQELGTKGLTWLAINSGEDQTTVAEYIAKYDYTFGVLLDPNNSGLYQYGIQSLPATIVVNKHGYIVALAIGSIDWRDEDVLDGFRNLLAEK